MSELIHVKGLDELSKFLDQLPHKLQANVLKSALRAGAKPIAADAKRRCPVGEPSAEGKRLYGHYKGALRDSIRIGTIFKRGRATAVVKVGGKSKGADIWYAHIIEFTGAAAHAVRGKLGGSLFLGGLFRRSVHHPGMKARPFLRPALNAQAQNAMVETAKYLRTRLSTKEGLSAAANVRLGG